MSRKGKGRPPFLFRLGWFLRTRPILLRRFVQGRLADRRSPRSVSRVRHSWSPAAAGGLWPRVWTSSPVVREYLHRRVSGDPACDWVTWMLHRHARGLRLSALVLGCGEGWLERALAKDARIEEVTGVDLSPEAVAEAARQAAEDPPTARVRHAVVDLETDPLPEGPFDLVLAHDVLHHLRDLEGLFARISRVLAPGGTLLFCEYAGPRRFDYGKRREAILDEELRRLPEKYRRLPGGRGLAERGNRTDPGELAMRDPSEAVRSDQILPALEKTMTVIEVIPYGGSLLAPLLYELVANFEEGNEQDQAVLRGLCERERQLIADGTLPSDYVVAAARARTEPPAGT